MKIYVLRHGETEFNSKNLIMGRTDEPLNEQGEQQARTAAEKIASLAKDALPTRIICSPLIRARQTASIVAEKIEKNCGRIIQIEYDERLIEQDYGEFEGTSRLSKEFADSKREFAYPTGNTGESHFMLAQRVYNILDELTGLQGGRKCRQECSTNRSGENILLVTHGGIMRVICSYFNKMKKEEYAAHRA